MSDNALSAALKFDQFIRGDVVVWFLAFWLSFGLALLSIVMYVNVNSEDINRDYIATTLNEEILTPVSTLRPTPLPSEVISEWLRASLRMCFTMDWQSYGYARAKCISQVMSLRKLPFSQESRGHYFYRQLEESGITSLLIDQRTFMSPEIEDIRLVSQGIKTFEHERLTRTGLPDTRVEKRYMYEYEVVMKLNMIGQKLDAPVKYQVLIERQSQLLREHGLGIRSIVSVE